VDHAVPSDGPGSFTAKPSGDTAPDWSVRNPPDPDDPEFSRFADDFVAHLVAMVDGKTPPDWVRRVMGFPR
jgi:hypothetical protein